MKLKEIVRNRRYTLFRYQEAEAELCGQKAGTLLGTSKITTSHITSSAC